MPETHLTNFYCRLAFCQSLGSQRLMEHAFSHQGYWFGSGDVCKKELFNNPVVTGLLEH